MPVNDQVNGSENRFEAVMKAAQQRGIDPDLLPYLEEADRKEERDEKLEGISETDKETLTQQLQGFIESNSWLAGPDPTILEEFFPNRKDKDNGKDIEKTARISKQNELGVNFDNLANTSTIEAFSSLSQLESESSALGDTESVDTDNEDETLAETTRLLTEKVYNHSLAQTCEEIYQNLCLRRPEHKIAPTKARVEKVLDALGNPQNSYDTIHVAGTNGKTSTTRMIDALLTAFGLNTGRFTSPHLISVCERISLYQKPISNATFVETYQDIAPVVQWIEAGLEESGLGKLSFFEYLTVLAFQVFAQAPVDTAVVEVGMGGTWDSTNVIDSKIQVITPVALDHQEYLGDTLDQIAAEKAGIIPPGGIVVLAKQAEAAREIILQQASRQGAHVYEYGVDFEIYEQKIAVGGQMFSLRTPAGTYEDVYLPLHGKHQAENAALAIMAAELYQGSGSLAADKLERALKEVSSPGRLEMIRQSPRILVDCAHNPQGAQALAATLEDAFDFKRVVGVFSAMRDKEIEAVLSYMEPVLDSLVVLEMPGERAADLETLTTIAQEVFGQERVESADSLASAIDIATTLAEADHDPQAGVGVIVFGSVMLAGHAQEICLENKAGNVREENVL